MKKIIRAIIVAESSNNMLNKIFGCINAELFNLDIWFIDHNMINKSIKSLKLVNEDIIMPTFFMFPYFRKTSEIW